MSNNSIALYNPAMSGLTKYLFYTGKGGVGKTSVASATAVSLADQGKLVLLISTDPASNLQDVFNTPLSNKGTSIKEVPNLTVLNLDPEEAAREYRESIVAPYRGVMSQAILANIEEQLSGSCTVEIAAFNEFSEIITSKEKAAAYDYIVFDTAPTGHTLRMLELPSAWNSYFDGSQADKNFVGQLAGMGDKRELYRLAVETLSNPELTTLMLVTRPDYSPLQEVARSSNELQDISINNQVLIVNGLLTQSDTLDAIATQLYEKQQQALDNMPDSINSLQRFAIPLRTYNVTGVDNLRLFFVGDNLVEAKAEYDIPAHKQLGELVEYLYATNKRVIFTMGKGGVGKTTMAATIAVGLAKRGTKVHLTTTDPADHLKYVIASYSNISISKIDPEQELKNYKQEIISKAKASGMNREQIDYIEEDLRSPCTQEIAIFRAFADIVHKADDEVIVIDTAPTGHTLLLLDATQSYHKEVERTHGDIPASVRNLLPRLRDESETEVIIVTLPETTPVFEAQRLRKDLTRAGIHNNWWIVNSSMLLANTTSDLLRAKASTELQWLHKVSEITTGNFVVIPWHNKTLQGSVLEELL